MRIKEVFEKINKAQLSSDWFDAQPLFDSLGVYDYVEIDQSRFKSYYVFSNWCTDQRVGEEAVFFDDRPLCYIIKKYRKSTPEIYFYDEQAFNAFYKYILSLLDVDAVYFVGDMKIDDYKTFEFASSLRHIPINLMCYSGKKIDDIIFPSFKHISYYTEKKVDIVVDGNKINVDVSDIQVKPNLK